MTRTFPLLVTLVLAGGAALAQAPAAPPAGTLPTFTDVLPESAG